MSTGTDTVKAEPLKRDIPHDWAAWQLLRLHGGLVARDLWEGDELEAQDETGMNTIVDAILEAYDFASENAAELRQALEDRKIIERAKGVMMRVLKLDEQDAFRRLQKLSASKNKKLVVMAQEIIDAAQAFSER